MTITYNTQQKDTWSNKQIIILISFPSIILLFSTIFFIILNNSPDRSSYWVNQISLFININQYLSSLSYFWINITQLGDALIFFPLVSFLIIWRPQAWASMFAAIPVATFLSIGGKYLAAIPRPAAVLDHRLFNIIGDTLTAHNSLPSGHTLTAFAIITAIMGSLLLLPFKKIHYLYLLLGLCLASIIALSRIAVGAHWPFDTIIGALFGYIAGLTGVILTQRYKYWWIWLYKPKYYFIFGLILMVWSISLISLNTTGYNLPIIWLSSLSAFIVSIYLLIKFLLNKLHI